MHGDLESARKAALEAWPHALQHGRSVLQGNVHSRAPEKCALFCDNLMAESDRLLKITGHRGPYSGFERFDSQPEPVRTAN